MQCISSVECMRGCVSIERLDVYGGRGRHQIFVESRSPRPVYHCVLWVTACSARVLSYIICVILGRLCDSNHKATPLNTHTHNLVASRRTTITNRAPLRSIGAGEGSAAAATATTTRLSLLAVRAVYTSPRCLKCGTATFGATGRDDNQVGAQAAYRA